MPEFSLGTAALGTEIDLSGLKRDQGKAKSETDSWLSGLQSTAKKGFGGLQKTVGIGLLGGLGVVTGGLAALTAEFSDSVKLAETQRDAEKQLAAVLESTGNAAGLSADEIKTMASELQGVTNFGDEATIAGQNLLLTFTGIGKDVFPRATETMLDMSQALGQDMKSSAVQLGKALNDPIAGVSALSRVGVSFTEQQKEQIAAMVEAGDVAGAQTLILDELAKEFGGSARAMADPAVQLGNAWGDFKEVIGGAVLPILNNLQATALPLVNQAIGTASTLISGFTGALSSGLTPLDALRLALSTTFGDGAQPLLDFIGTVTGIIEKIQQIPGVVMPIVQPIVDLVTQFVSWKDILIAVGVVAATIIIPILAGIVAAVAPVIAVAALLVGGIALLRHAWESDFLGMRTALIAFWENSVKPAFAEVQRWAGENLPTALATLQRFWEDRLLPAIRAVWSFIQTSVIPLLGALVNVWFAALRVEIALVQAAWETVLLPALRTVWAFIRDNVIPIFDGMNRSVGGIGTVISGVIGWLDTLASKFNSLADNIPEWLIPGSPTPFELGMRGIADAMRQAARAGELLDSSLATRDLVTVGAGGRDSFVVTQNIYGADPTTTAGESAGRLRSLQRRKGSS